MNTYFTSKARHSARVDALRNIGNPNTAKTFLSKRDRENDPRRQRKTKKWRLDID